MVHILKTLFRRNKTAIEHHEKNVVDSIVQARKLYKELIVKAHPDRNPNNIELAKSLSQKIIENQYDYAELKKIQQILNNKLQNYGTKIH